MVRNSIRPVRIRDVHLNDHQVGFIVKVELLYVLILKRDLEIWIEISRQSREAQWRKERVFDGPPERTRSFRQRREN